ncbi:uncharacterized protein ATNIH1004_000391 [Aspergillus tanneri]|nr:uncharacterized protein ATNIH1004_000391 [Aspergillus tanneri]KAA8651503.1 hypothetical protein ATNIH1004_000391 [Aspergillus tanneri]
MTDPTIPPTDVSTKSPQGFVLHVLCPSLPPPNRFTFKDLTPSTTVAGLKTHISQFVPNHPAPETQRLIYRGKPLANDGVSLQSVLDLTPGSEYSMHLVLPPAPTQPLPTGVNTQPPFLPGRLAPANYTQTTQELRYRGSTTPAAQNETEIGQTIRQNIEEIRRQIELRRGTTSSRDVAWQQTTHSLPTPPVQLPMSNPVPLSPQLPDESRLRLHLIQPQITLCEDQLNRGIAPPIDHIIRLRSQLLQILDEQYRNPHSERDSSIESMLTRVFNIYTRADQLRVMQSRFPSATLQRPSPATTPGNVEASQAPLYLLSSPDGFQGIVTSPRGEETIQASLEALRAAHASQTALNNPPGHPTGAHPNPNAAAMGNAVRQAILNQRAGANHEGFSLSRSIRRLWLFVRLYFFCYMFSEPGTWSRVLFVSLAVLASLLSETGIPQQLYRMIVTPVQQHLEGLVHFPAGTGNMGVVPNLANPPTEAGNRGQPSLVSELRHNLRRVERSLALFIASLVPGVGERHVEVRNAAEAARNAERAREEEERRRREEAANDEGTPAQQQPEQPEQ